MVRDFCTKMEHLVHLHRKKFYKIKQRYKINQYSILRPHTPFGMMILQKDGLHHTHSFQVFIKTVQFIIINGTRLLYKNEHLVHYYTEKNFIR